MIKQRVRNICRRRRLTYQFGLLCQERERPLADRFVFWQGRADGVVETSPWQPGYVRLLVTTAARQRRWDRPPLALRLVEFAGEPMDEPVLRKTLALGLNVFRIWELPNNDFHRFG